MCCIVFQEEVLLGALLNFKVAARQVVIHNLINILIGLEVEGTVQLGQCQEDGRPRLLILKGTIAELGEEIESSASLNFRLIGAIFTKNPCNDLH